MIADVKAGRELYLRMLDSDRDATLLRLFEAFLESAPQTLIQGYFFLVHIREHLIGGAPLHITFGFASCPSIVYWMPSICFFQW